jgi:purine nucleosidase
VARQRRAWRFALWGLVALPLLALLTFALPVDEWRTGQRAADPLPLVPGGPAVTMPRRVWIDTDAACGHADDADADDCFALLILLRAPGVEIVGISSVDGNAKAGTSEATAKVLVAMLDRHGSPPVYRGSAKESIEEEPAAAKLREALAEGPLTIVALGPLTNIAAALRKRPDLAARIGRIVAVLGRRPGHLFHPAEGHGDGILFGHGPVFRDFNFDKDRAAATEILAHGIPLTLIPYEAARSVIFGAADLDRLSRGDRAAAWVARRAKGWLGFWARVVGRDGFYPFDALAAAYVLDPSLFDCADAPAWVAKDRRLWGGFFGAEAFLVGTEHERAEAPRASGRVIYCARAAPTMRDWLMQRLTGR